LTHRSTYAEQGAGMHWEELAKTLFGTHHTVVAEGDFISGSAEFEGQTIAIVGTTHHAAIGVALALRQARGVLDTMTAHPGRPIVLFIDTQGQQLRRRDELLGINRAMAHLGCCIDQARRRGHAVIGLVYSQALSGGFITSGLIADACYALPDAEIRVMGIPAMARVTKLSEALLTELSRANPVFAPGVENYVAMGGVRAVWRHELSAGLREALADRDVSDRRARDGAARGGRRLAERVAQQVLDAA
jgi:malonate decarboxylase gamma subunit